MSVERLATLLRAAGCELTDELLAEAVWMAEVLFDPARQGTIPLREDPPATPGPDQDAEPPAASGQAHMRPRPPLPHKAMRSAARKVDPAAGALTQDAEARANLKPVGDEGAEPGAPRGARIAVTGGYALEDARALGRALQPLRRRALSRRHQVLDEELTIQRIAEERVFLPVQRPLRERWLALNLVLDYSGSMDIWHKLLAELRLLLLRLDIFRNVRSWALSADAAEPVLRPLAQRTLPDAPKLRPAALVDPTGRTLTLVVSDCVGQAWHTGHLARAIELWGKTGPVAVLQVLPERLWNRSALRTGQPAALWGLAGAPNSQLKASVQTSLRQRGKALPPGVNVPVLALEAAALHAYAQVLTGATDLRAQGVRLPLPGDPKAASARVEASTTASASDDASPAARFQRSTSPGGLELATLLAAAPVINLPLIRIFQSPEGGLLPSSRRAHLAEVFLGGILKPIAPGDAPDSVLYDFVPGAREELLALASHDDTRRAFAAVSQFIAQHKTRDERFRALLETPDGEGDAVGATLQAAFAQASASVLRSLGYAELAEALLAAHRSTAQQELDEQAEASGAPANFERGYALLVGVGSQHARGPDDHDFVSTEALVLAEALGADRAGRFLPEHVTLLYDEHATAERIVAALGQLAELTTGDDVLLLVFAAPWAEDASGMPAMLTYDSGWIDEGLIGGVDVETLRERIANLSARAALIVFSAYDSVPPFTYRELRQLIIESFSRDELRVLCFELNIDEEYLPGQTRQIKVQELIEYCRSRGLTANLLQQLRRFRPNHAWPSVQQLEPPKEVLPIELIDQLAASDPRRIVLTSTPKGQRRSLNDEQRSTPFGLSLAEALRGEGLPDRGGYLSAFDVCDQVFQGTLERSLDLFGVEQAPELTLRIDAQDFPLGLHPATHTPGVFEPQALPRMPVRWLSREMGGRFTADEAAWVANQLRELDREIRQLAEQLRASGDPEQDETLADLDIAVLHLRAALSAFEVGDVERVQRKLLQIARDLPLLDEDGRRVIDLMRRYVAAWRASLSDMDSEAA
jgi:hypothetical protein